MNINASDMSSEFLIMVKNTFPELFKKYESGDESAIENMKYLNFGYTLKNNQLGESEGKLIRLEMYIHHKVLGNEYKGMHKEEFDNMFNPAYLKKHGHWVI